MLTVTKAGSGSGTVTSDPTGIICGASCSAPFAGGTSVTLAATPSAGADQRFLGFTGDCASQTETTCTSTIDGDRSVTATFGLCSASYPDVCIPPPPPDLDCGEIAPRNFTVLHGVAAPDPHGFDADGNGVGCEE